MKAGWSEMLLIWPEPTSDNGNLLERALLRV
jgi:hypothetical protein